jgi:hypothetical protein
MSALHGGIVKNLILILIFCSISSTAFCEEPHRVEAKLVFGASAFLDEDIPFDHSILGGSVPFRITNRMSVEPQFLYMEGPGSDRDFTLTGNILYDVVTRDRFTFYVVGGAGLIRNTQRFGTRDFSASDWTANGGIGAKFFITEKLFVSSEFRFGWEPLLTTIAAIGYRF